MGRLDRTNVHALIRYAFDIAGVVLAWFLTFQVRLLLNPFFSRRLTAAELQNVVPPLAYVVLMWICAYGWLSFRRVTPRTNTRETMLMNAVESAILANILTSSSTFLFREIGTDLSRSFSVLLFPISSITAAVARFAASSVIGISQDRAPERVAVIGHGEEAWDIADRIGKFSESAALAGLILPHNGAHVASSRRVLGTTAMLAELINQTDLDRIIVVNGCVTDAEFHECDRISNRMGVVLNRVMPLPSVGRRVGLEQRFGMPLLEIRPVPFTRSQELIKRAFDIVVAVLALLALSPLFLTVALLIKLTSNGPLCYSARRVGKGGRYFSFIKFRSMYTNRSRAQVAAHNEKSGRLFKIKNDPRITPVGRFIRKYSLDELPQLINVLRGDMSLVGPRPLPAEDLDPDGQSREFAEWSNLRSQVLPGISGLWQIKGRSDLSFEDMIELDTEYIRRWSLTLDTRILLNTPFVVITGKGAY